MIDEFLTRTSGQLTYTGLLQLHECTHERELSVFFRNNHFNCMFKVWSGHLCGSVCGRSAHLPSLLSLHLGGVGCRLQYNNELYLLITDLGYSRQSQIVWEKLDEVRARAA